MRRATALLASFGALAAATRPARAQAAPIRVGMGAVESYAEGFYAVEMGFFKDAGLDVSPQTVNGGGAALTAALVAGAIDISVSNTSAVALAHLRGLPIAVLLPSAIYTAGVPTTTIAVLKDGPIRTAKDLTGKVMALSTLRDLQQVGVQAWIDANGGDSKSVRFIESPSAQHGPGLLAGRFDAAVQVEPFIVGTKNDLRTLALPYDALAKQFMLSGWAVNTGWLKNNGAVAQRFAAVMRSTATWANDNPKPVEAILAKVTRISPDVVAQMSRLRYGTVLDASLMQPIIDATAHYGFLARSFPATELFAVASK